MTKRSSKSLGQTVKGSAAGSWRVGGLEGWRVGGLEGWRVGGLGWVENLFVELTMNIYKDS